MQTHNTKFKTIWISIPLVIRAILVGFLVSTFGVATWLVFSIYIPSPWSLPAMAIFLWFFWKYFSGSWFPRSTKEVRIENFRKTKLSKYEWKWGIIAAIIFVILLHSGLALTFRFIDYPSELFKEEYQFIGELPKWLAWLAVIMSSLVAGICEEIGFRGYMQVPLEKKYNPKIAIVVVSIVFVLVHLHQAWSGPIIIHIFLISILIGYFAYAFNSLIPGIIAHVSLDIINFSYWWSDLLGEFTLKPISDTGLDIHFIIVLTIFILSTTIFIWINKKVINRKKLINA